MLGMLSVLFAALVLAVMGASPASAGGAVSGDEVSASSSADVLPQSTYKDCPSTYFCVYDANGRMCKWQDNSRDWYAECSWAGVHYPKYAYNHGTSGIGVTIYRYTGYGSAIGGCIEKGEKVTLAGTYNIGSHKWNC